MTLTPVPLQVVPLMALVHMPSKRSADLDERGRRRRVDVRFSGRWTVGFEAGTDRPPEIDLLRRPTLPPMLPA